MAGRASCINGSPTHSRSFLPFLCHFFWQIVSLLWINFVLQSFPSNRNDLVVFSFQDCSLWCILRDAGPGLFPGVSVLRSSEGVCQIRTVNSKTPIREGLQMGWGGQSPSQEHQRAGWHRLPWKKPRGAAVPAYKSQARRRELRSRRGWKAPWISPLHAGTAFP